MLRWLFMVWFGCGLFAQAQTDSTQVVAPQPVDSLSPDTTRRDTPPPRTPIPGEDTFGQIDTALQRQLIEQRRQQLAEAKRGPIARAKAAWRTYQQVYGPRLFENEAGKMRLYLRLPQRDSLVLPVPKGLLAAGSRPPYDPEVAWQRSALVPGLGQAYNRSYWKMPLWWAGYGAIGWWISFNQDRYRLYGNAYFCDAVLEQNGCTIPDDLQGIDTEGLRTRRNQFRQNRDNAILWMIGWHSLQVIEAFIDAHLKGFDVSEDLSLRLGPGSPVAAFGLPAPGVGISLGF